MKRGTPDHPKTRRLVRRLNVGLAAVVGHLELLWHWTAKFAPQGDVGRFSDADIEDGAGWTGAPGALVEALLAEGFLDADPRHRLLVHDWADHADEATKKALVRRKLAILTTRRDNVGPCLDNGGPCLDNGGRRPDMSRPPEPEPEPEPGEPPPPFLPPPSEPGDRGAEGEGPSPAVRTIGLARLAAAQVEMLQFEVGRLAQREATTSGVPVDRVLREASLTPRGACFADPETCPSADWLQATQDRLEARWAQLQRWNARHPPRPPDESYTPEQLEAVRRDLAERFPRLAIPDRGPPAPGPEEPKLEAEK